MELLLVVNVNSGQAVIDLGCMSGNMRMAAREVYSVVVREVCLVQANVEISLEVKVDFLVQVSRDSFLEVRTAFPMAATEVI